MKALGLVVSDKIFENCNLKIYFLMDDGQGPVTIAHPEHFVLRWAKKPAGLNYFFFNLDRLIQYTFIKSK